MSVMSKATEMLDKLLDPVGRALGPDAARAILSLRADPETHTKIDDLAHRCNEGLLTPHERLERMAAVDRNILRSGVAELLAFPATPRPVVINEAIEIARRFSSPDAVQFINGVLDSIARELGTIKKSG